MAAAIYARYSSENQRPESIDDQGSACRKLAKLRSLRSPTTTSTPTRRSPAPALTGRR
jgi:hypothetical protein